MSRAATMAEKAQAAWNGNPPEWVRELALACDAHGLRKTAARLKCSPAMLSLAVNNRREGLEFVKGKAEAQLMAAIIYCPVLGLMPKRECLQKQAAQYSPANPLEIQLYRACRNGCAWFNQGKEQEL